MRMLSCTRRGLLEELLRVFAISVITVTWTQGQVTTFGGCPNYQISPSVTKTFNDSLIAEAAGYSILMTTDGPKAEGCYVIKFLADQKFSLDYVNGNYEPVKHEGRFDFHPPSFTDSAYVYLGLPGSVLGGGLFGGSRLYIVYVGTDYFVAISCGSSGILKTEHVYVFAKASAMTVLTPMISTINGTLETEGIPHAKMFREVDQTCMKPAPGPPSGKLLQLMELLGASCPTARHLITQYRSALETDTESTPPQHRFTSNFHTQDVTYPEIGNPASPLSSDQFSSHNGFPDQIGTYLGIRNWASTLPTHQFSPNYGAAVPIGTYPRYVSPASPLPIHQFSSNAGAVIPIWTFPRYVNPTSTMPSHQFSSHNGVPDQIRTYPGIRHPVSAATPAVGFSPPGVFQTPYSGLQNF